MVEFLEHGILQKLVGRTVEITLIVPGMLPKICQNHFKIGETPDWLEVEDEMSFDFKMIKDTYSRSWVFTPKGINFAPAAEALLKGERKSIALPLSCSKKGVKKESRIFYLRLL